MIKHLAGDETLKILERRKKTGKVELSESDSRHYPRWLLCKLSRR